VNLRQPTHFRLTILILAALFVMSLSGADYVALAGPLRVDPGLPDTLKIDSVRSMTTVGVVRVPLTFFNDEQLQAMEVTISHTSPKIVFDSISFAGSRVSYITIRGFKNFGNAITAYCLVTSEAVISAGGGLFGTLYCHTVGTITPQLIPIDTFTFVDVDREYSNTFSDAASNQIKPQVKRGYINFQTSCCVNRRGNVDGDPNDMVDISDIQYLVDYLMSTSGTITLPCPEEANVDGSADGAIDISDLSYLIDYLILGTVLELPPCQ
jgi:hypothetical protein